MSNEIVPPDARLPAIAGASQSTAIEQTRAVAEVYGAITVAKRHPRDTQIAIDQMRQSCQILALAERAFFRFPRAGKNVSGASVHLARELARCWGNLDYGIKELDRDDRLGISEMLAFAWDLETNARSETTFIVPHIRDTKHGQVPLTDVRDIYENNANMGARRLRECIFSVLPPWFTEEAKELCAGTLRNGGGKPLDIRIADAVKAFKGIGITQKQLEKKIGRGKADWSDVDVAGLGVTFKSIQRGEINKADEFPEEAPPEKLAKDRLDAIEDAITDEHPDPSLAGADAPPPGSAPATSPPEPTAGSPDLSGAARGALSVRLRDYDSATSWIEGVHAVIDAADDPFAVWEEALNDYNDLMRRKSIRPEQVGKLEALQAFAHSCIDAKQQVENLGAG